MNYVNVIFDGQKQVQGKNESQSNVIYCIIFMQISCAILKQLYFLDQKHIF